MTDVICPQCGQITSLPSIRRASSEFCSHCDFPLFWAPTAVPETELATIGSDTTLRRLPGAGGRLLIGTKVCPACGELNSISAVVCARCGADMDPKPVVIVEAAPPPPPPPLPPPEPPKRDLVPLLVFLLIVVVGTAGGLALYL